MKLFLFSIITLPLLLTSCASQFQVSLDLHKQKYKSQLDEGDAKLGAGTNMAMMVWMGWLGSKGSSSTMLNDKNNYSTLWASVDNGMSVIDYSRSIDNHSIPQYKKPSTTFSENLRIYSGVELITKRSHEGLVKTNLNYFEVPVFVIYEKDLSQGQIFGGLGPYFAYGLGGKTKITFNGNTTTTKSFDNEVGFKRLDGGLNLTIGYRFQNELAARLGYDFGLLNIARADAEYKEWNRTISFNVSYPIEKIREKLRNNE